MRRRDFLKACGASPAGLALGAGPALLGAEAARPLAVGTGPQLFLDDYLIAQLDGLMHRVEPPERQPKPVLDSWQRFREPFLDRNPRRGSWDHAMTWISATLAVGDEVRFYYGGYARGHKVAPGTERQIGLARMKRDRYVALTPEGAEGVLRTKPFLLSGDRLTVNARAPDGEVRVQLLDGAGRPLAALGDADAKPVSGDVLAGEVRWPRPLGALRGQPVCLEFRVRRGQLFGFELHSQQGSARGA